MRRFAMTFLLLTAAATSNACLKTKTTHVLYLSPSGAVTWSVSEDDVHSDDQDRAKRDQEEADFVRAVEEGTHGALVALVSLGGRDAATALTRRDRPWEARTSARFDRADVLAASILRELGIAGAARLQVSGDRVTLAVEWGSDEATAEDSPMLALIEAHDAYRIVLTGGRFIAAEGFRISPDGRTAVPVEQTGAPEAPWRVSLTWTAPRSARP